MAFLYEVGTIIKNTDPAGPSNQTTITLTYAPKLLFLWSVGQPATSDVWIDSNAPFLSWVSSSLSGYGASLYNADGSTGSNTFWHTLSTTASNGAFRILNSAGTVAVEGDVTFDTVGPPFGFTITLETANDSNATPIHYLAIGGTQTNNALAGVFSSPGAPGNRTISGLGFQPELAGVFRAETFNNDYNQWQIGFADGTSMGSSHQRNEWTSSAQGVSTQTASKLIHSTAAAGSNEAVATLSSFTAGGAVLNFTTAQPGATWNDFFLAGPHVKVGTFNKTTTAGPTTQTISGLPFNPGGIILFGTGTASGTTTSGSRMSFGACDGTDHASIVFTSQDASSPSNVAAMSSTTHLWIKANNDTKTVDASCTLQAFTLDGFTLAWDVNDAVATPIGYLVFGAYPIPHAVTGAATVLTPVGATLNGTVSAQAVIASEAMTYQFDYGLTTGYGSNTTPVTNQLGVVDVAVQETISGLLPNTVYHFRVVAFNAAETTYGADQTFTTLENDQIIWVI